MCPPRKKSGLGERERSRGGQEGHKGGQSRPVGGWCCQMMRMNRSLNRLDHLSKMV